MDEGGVQNQHLAFLPIFCLAKNAAMVALAQLQPSWKLYIDNHWYLTPTYSSLTVVVRLVLFSLDLYAYGLWYLWARANQHWNSLLVVHYSSSHPTKKSHAWSCMPYLGMPQKTPIAYSEACAQRKSKDAKVSCSVCGTYQSIQHCFHTITVVSSFPTVMEHFPSSSSRASSIRAWRDRIVKTTVVTNTRIEHHETLKITLCSYWHPLIPGPRFLATNK